MWSSTLGARPRPMIKTAESSHPGALPCVRVIWVASRLTPAAAVVAAVRLVVLPVRVLLVAVLLPALAELPALAVLLQRAVLRAARLQR